MLRKKSLLALLLSLCMVAAMVPVAVLAAGQYVPGEPYWTGYANQVQWKKPSNATGSTYLEYKVQLVLNDSLVEEKSVEIKTYVFFYDLTQPQEAYTLKVQARQIYLNGDPDGYVFRCKVRDKCCNPRRWHGRYYRRSGRLSGGI